MSDQGIWFKLWCSSLDDSALDNLNIEDFGRWCKLGTYMKKHGKGGTVEITSPARTLCSMFQVADFAALHDVFHRLPNVETTCNENTVTGVTVATVTFKNWQRYQGDNSLERVRKFRERVTANVTDKKRREEKRGEREEKKEIIETSSLVLPHDTTAQKVLRKPAGAGIPNMGEWPSVDAFVSFYNERTPDECPAVQPPLSAERQKKARLYLKQFPEQAYWEEVYQQVHASQFLRGLRPSSNGHGNFRADFDWLLSKGKDGSENFVKVHDGRYHN